MNKNNINYLLEPSVYSHKVIDIKLIETHISWIVLTGIYAYKIKKPLNNEYIQSSTIIQRLNYCKEEIRLNTRYNHTLYLGISVIYSTSSKYYVDDSTENDLNLSDSKVLDYAIKMKQINQLFILSNISAQRLDDILFRRLGKSIGTFHLRLKSYEKKTDNNILVSIEHHNKVNLEHLSELKPTNNDLNLLSIINSYMSTDFRLKQGIFLERYHLGFFKECHGDLHCDNIYVNNEYQLEIFDGIEFKESLRMIDQISDIIFIVMDLQARGNNRQSLILLNNWLYTTGDYLGLILYQWYYSYRALVRAKANYQRLKQIQTNTIDQIKTESSSFDKEIIINKYLQTAYNVYQQATEKILILMHGFSGSGKTYLSKKLCIAFNGIRISSDIERNRFCQDNNITQVDKYSEFVTNIIYEEKLSQYAKYSLEAGFNTIIDATFLKARERKKLINTGFESGAKIAIVFCSCSEKTAASRIKSRLEQANDESEADFQIRKSQKKWIEKITFEEIKITVHFNEKSNIMDCITEIRKKASTIIPD